MYSTLTHRARDPKSMFLIENRTVVLTTGQVDLSLAVPWPMQHFLDHHPVTADQESRPLPSSVAGRSTHDCLVLGILQTMAGL